MSRVPAWPTVLAGVVVVGSFGCGRDANSPGSVEARDGSAGGAWSIDIAETPDDLGAIDLESVHLTPPESCDALLEQLKVGALQDVQERVEANRDRVINALAAESPCDAFFWYDASALRQRRPGAGVLLPRSPRVWL